MIAMAVTDKKNKLPIFIVHDSILAVWWENNFPIASFIFRLLVVIELDRISVRSQPNKIDCQSINE